MAAGPAFEILRMEAMGSEELPLEHGHLSAFVSGVGRTTFAVTARRHYYDLRLRLVSGAEVDELSGNVACCELRSTDPQLPFVWSAWSRQRMMNFRIVSDPGPISYAAWVEGNGLYFEEIREGRDPNTAMIPFVARYVRPLRTGGMTWGSAPLAAPTPGASGLFCLRIDRPMGSSDFHGGSAAGLDIRAQSIARDETGQWTVKVTGPNSARVYTFVSPDGVAWERK